MSKDHLDANAGADTSEGQAGPWFEFKKHDLADWLLRDGLPQVLDAIDRRDEASVLRELPAVTAEQLGSRKRYPGVLPILQPLGALLQQDNMNLHNAAVRCTGWSSSMKQQINNPPEKDIRPAA